MDAIEILDEMRDKVLALPAKSRLRLRYRNLRQGLANATEEVRAGDYCGHGFLNDPADMAETLRQDVEAVYASLSIAPGHPEWNKAALTVENAIRDCRRATCKK
jgi:hypothetical protein